MNHSAAPKTYRLFFRAPGIGNVGKLKKILGVVKVLDVNIDDEIVTISATGDIHMILGEYYRKHKKVIQVLPDEDNPSSSQIVPVQNSTRQPEGPWIGRLRNSLPRSTTVTLQGPSSNHIHRFEITPHVKRFSCNGCREDGFGSRYGCMQLYCEYVLHKECNDPEPTITPEFFDGSSFKLVDRPSNAKPCFACGRNVCGHFYYCETKGLNLHPRCANLKAKIWDMSSQKEFILTMKASSNCTWCGAKEALGAKSWSYVSTENKKCSLHVHCITEMAQEVWKKSEMQQDEASMALANIGAHNMVVSRKRKRGISVGLMKNITIILFKLAYTIFFGDPTLLLASIVGLFQ